MYIIPISNDRDGGGLFLYHFFFRYSKTFATHKHSKNINLLSLIMTSQRPQCLFFREKIHKHNFTNEMLSNEGLHAISTNFINF